jgi:hypothetical protein
VLKNDSLYASDFTFKLDERKAVTEPYWMASPAVGSLFSTVNSEFAGLPVAPGPSASVQVSINDFPIDIQVPFSSKRLDPLRGDVIEALRIVPTISVAFESPLVVVEKGNEPMVKVRIKNYGPGAKAKVGLTSASGKALGSEIDLLLSKESDTIVSIKCPQSAENQTVEQIGVAVTTENGQRFTKSLNTIRYDHLPVLPYQQKATCSIVKKTWQNKVKRIGYVEGAGENMALILRQCGVEVNLLKDADLKDAQMLRHYDAILVGIRAVNVKKESKSWLPVLFDYAKNGGTLVMQYNTQQDLATTALGPYPFTLSNTRVTQEDAEVRITNADHRLLTKPNPISASDFDDWVQERGIYFAKDADKHYETMLSMNDTKEPALETAILYTPWGEGHYIYTSLAFFRQLPAMNQGSIRLLMNLLNAGK